ncbi:hypothetical protein [Streptomyces sp. NRRL F-2799]|uniref:restriction system modified-DNA reader domain-containing protein n=1 Tax=Streptomyces sp. NRRL F-2799 TaxID=1463844 RepID=UPI0004C5DED4|nr:hypothetical protein [Streptomyces sp. NRRL F-2799]
MSDSMRDIQVDDEVFAYLQSRSVPLVDTPNDVLRRLLLKDGARSAGEPDGRRPGSLMSIIEAGLAAPGDKLRYHQSRLKRTHEALISSDGWVELPDGRAFPQPSPALKAQIQTEVNAWRCYVHVPSGRLLQELRLEAASALQE